MCWRLWHQCHNHWTYKSIFCASQASDGRTKNGKGQLILQFYHLFHISFIILRHSLTNYSMTHLHHPNGTYLWFLSVNRHWKPADHWINIFSTYISNISFIVSYYNLSHFNFCCHHSEAKLGSFCFTFCGWTGDLFPQFLFSWWFLVLRAGSTLMERV